MSPNMGLWDRALRFVGALGLIWVVFFTEYLQGEWILTGLAIGFASLNIFAITTSWCPMYCITGSDTRPKSEIGSS